MIRSLQGIRSHISVPSRLHEGHGKQIQSCALSVVTDLLRLHQDQEETGMEKFRKHFIVCLAVHAVQDTRVRFISSLHITDWEIQSFLLF